MNSGTFIALNSSRKVVNRDFMPLKLGKFLCIKKHNSILFIPPLSIVLVLFLKIDIHKQEKMPRFIDVCVLTNFSVSCLSHNFHIIVFQVYCFT